MTPTLIVVDDRRDWKPYYPSEGYLGDELYRIILEEFVRRL